jgi:hypothetical protein
MYITSLFWILFSVVFALIFRKKARNQFVTKVDVDDSDYHIHEMCGGDNDEVVAVAEGKDTV